MKSNEVNWLRSTFCYCYMGYISHAILSAYDVHTRLLACVSIRYTDIHADTGILIQPSFHLISNGSQCCAMNNFDLTIVFFSAVVGSIVIILLIVLGHIVIISLCVCTNKEKNPRWNK